MVPVTFNENDKIVRPDQYEDKPEFGLVLKVGEGRLLDSGSRVPPPAKEGDFIVYGKYSTLKVNADGVDYFFVRDEDIISIYEG